MYSEKINSSEMYFSYSIRAEKLEKRYKRDAIMELFVAWHMQLFLTKSVSLYFFVFKTRKLYLCEHFEKHKDIIENGIFSITPGYILLVYLWKRTQVLRNNEKNSCSGDT